MNKRRFSKESLLTLKEEKELNICSLQTEKSEWFVALDI